MNGLPWEKFFSHTIENAGNLNDKELFKYIVETDDIFLWTAFVQESGYMFDNMAKMAIKMNLTGKRIFVFRKQEAALIHAYFNKRLFNKAAKTNAFYFKTDDEKYNLDNKHFDLYDPKKYNE